MPPLTQLPTYAEPLPSRTTLASSCLEPSLAHQSPRRPLTISHPSVTYLTTTLTLPWLFPGTPSSHELTINFYPFPYHAQTTLCKPTPHATSHYKYLDRTQTQGWRDSSPRPPKKKPSWPLTHFNLDTGTLGIRLLSNRWQPSETKNDTKTRKAYGSSFDLEVKGIFFEVWFLE